MQITSTKKSGCLGSFLGGCGLVALALLAICIVGGYLLFGKLDVLLEKMKPVVAELKANVEEGKKHLMGAGVDLWMGSFITNLRNSGYSEVEQQKIIVPVREFADRVKRGEVGLERGLVVLDSIFNGPVGSTFKSRAWEMNYVRPSLLNETERRDAVRDINRYIFAVQDKRIPTEFEKVVNSIVISKTKDKHGTEHSDEKRRLTSSELTLLLASIREALTKANIPMETPAIDVAAELHAIFAKEAVSVPITSEKTTSQVPSTTL